MNCRFTTIDARTIRVTRALVCLGRFTRIDMRSDVIAPLHQRPEEGAGASS